MEAHSHNPIAIQKDFAKDTVHKSELVKIKMQCINFNFLVYHVVNKCFF